MYGIKLKIRKAVINFLFFRSKCSGTILKKSFNGRITMLKCEKTDYEFTKENTRSRIFLDKKVERSPFAMHVHDTYAAMK